MIYLYTFPIERFTSLPIIIERNITICSRSVFYNVTRIHRLIFKFFLTFQKFLFSNYPDARGNRLPPTRAMYSYIIVSLNRFVNYLRFAKQTMIPSYYGRAAVTRKINNYLQVCDWKKLREIFFFSFSFFTH